MPNPARGDVWRVWLFAGTTISLGAWIAPLLYNGGKALAEVSSNKITNGPLKCLADVCQSAEFPRFYQAGLWLAAFVLWLPWLEWLHARRNAAAQPDPRPWLLHQLDGAGLGLHVQPLRANPRWAWHTSAGFLITAGLLVALGPARACLPLASGSGLAVLAPQSLTATLALVMVMEVFFRGHALGIFLQAMRPMTALAMSAAFFALVLSALPLPGDQIANPETPGTGFEMLRLAAWRFANWPDICGNFLPLLALGGLLAYARWRTASLWLPAGLHAGWRVTHAIPCFSNTATPGAHDPSLSGNLIGTAVLPLAALLVAGALIHFLTATPPDRDAPL